MGEADLEPFGGFVVSATRAVFRMSDGREVKLTITAPVAEVESALQAAN